MEILHVKGFIFFAEEPGAAKKSRNARRRQMQKERDRKYRNEYRQNQNQKNVSGENHSADEKTRTNVETKSQEKPVQEKVPNTTATGDKQDGKSGKDSNLPASKTQNEPRSQSQPARRFDSRRDRSASARGRPQQGGYRGNSPSKRGGLNQRVFRGGFQGGNKQGSPGMQGQYDQKGNPRGPRPENQRPKSQSRDRRGQGFQQNRNYNGASRSSSKDGNSRNSGTRDTNNQFVNNARVNGHSSSNSKDTRQNVDKQVESGPKKGLETVPESKQETRVVAGEKHIGEKFERNNNDIDKKPVQSNGPKPVNSNKVEKLNTSPKVDENSNHRKSSATVRLTNNGNVPHEVSINDAPIVKKSVVSVEEVTRQQELGLPQRKPRLKRAEVIVNGDLNGIVNGHVEE